MPPPVLLTEGSGVFGLRENSNEVMKVNKRSEKPTESASDASSPANNDPAALPEGAAEAAAASTTARRSSAHEYARAAIVRAKRLTAAAATGTKTISGKVVAKVKEVDANHREVAGKIDTVSMGLGITSGVVTAGAALAAPTGLTAIGVALGLTSAPLIVTAAPLVSAAAAVTGAISGGAYFYSKWKSAKKTKADLAAQDAQPVDSPDAAP